MKSDKSESKSYCEEALNTLTGLLEHHQFDEKALNSLINEYPNCKKQLKETYALWQEMDHWHTPEPSTLVKPRFEIMLQEFKTSSEKTRVMESRRFNLTREVFKWAAIFVIGIAFGMLISRQNQTGNMELSMVNENPNVTALTISTSTTDRLIAVQALKADKNPTRQIYDALYTTLISDPNDNVRISAIEALQHFPDKAIIFNLLIKAVAYQESAMVQLSLLEAIIQNSDESNLNQIKQVLSTDVLDNEVRVQITENLNRI